MSIFFIVYEVRKQFILVSLFRWARVFCSCNIFTSFNIYKLIFQEFDDHRDADDAVYELNGKDLMGERLVGSLILSDF